MLSKKIEILEEAISSITAMIENTKDAAQDSQTEANYHKGAMQSRYDTFKEEAQYMVAASRERLSALKTFLYETSRLADGLRKNDDNIDHIDLGKCFCVKTRDSVEKGFFVVPFAHTRSCTIGGREFYLISDNSPVFHIFRGLRVGDYAECENEMYEDSEVVEIF